MQGRICPDESTLQDLAEGRLAGARGSEVQQHAAACGDCSRTLGELAGALPAALARTQSGDAPGTAPGPPDGEPRRLGPYRLVRKLGAGATGAVHEAVNEQIRRRCAIKILHPDIARDPVLTARFLNEARAVNIIQHAGVVSIFEFGTAAGVPYVVMEYLDGETLADRIERRGDLRGEVLRLGRQLASALAAAHDKGIVHRDLKPENVMLVPDPEVPGGERTKILDFGLAKLAAVLLEASGEQPKTRTESLMGTPAYMAPEQCRGAGRVDDRADVYSLGAVLGGTPKRPT